MENKKISFTSYEFDLTKVPNYNSIPHELYSELNKMRWDNAVRIAKESERPRAF
jgi:hypothetical protein